MRLFRWLPALAAVVLPACASESPVAPAPDAPSLSVGAESVDYLILANGNALPPSLEADLAAAGGTVTGRIAAIGVVMARSADPEFRGKAARLRGVQGVAQDLVVQWNDPTPRTAEITLSAEDVGQTSHAIGGHETFRLAQWAPDAVGAPAAWAAGALGAGARVAILDGGLRHSHIDLAPNLDAARSASFVPGQLYNVDVGTFWHGTHVAGIVAAAANNVGTVGIAPQATIIGVKVLHNGSGPFSGVLQGIIYAATPIAQGGAGAHIINMSLGALFLNKGPNIAHLQAVMNRAATWAYQRGVLVLAAAGNDALDFDHTANVIALPAQAANVIAISSTGPMGWALGATDLDRFASYSNYGQSAIGFAGPGGDFVLPGNAVCTRPRLPSGTLAVPCWIFDMVMSTVRGSGASNTTYSWAAGTSMATPAVAGVAALIVGKYGPMHPAQLEARLRMSADDLGKPGNDDYYGRGRVNALRAIQ